MIRLGAWLAAIGSLIFLWHECGEDLVVFCYRIGSGAVTGLRTRGLVPAPSQASLHSSASRNRSECLTPSFTSSTRFTARMD
jgi:hypothetical protein